MQKSILMYYICRGHTYILYYIISKVTFIGGLWYLCTIYVGGNKTTRPIVAKVKELHYKVYKNGKTSIICNWIMQNNGCSIT